MTASIIRILDNGRMKVLCLFLFIYAMTSIWCLLLECSWPLIPEYHLISRCRISTLTTVGQRSINQINGQWINRNICPINIVHRTLYTKYDKTLQLSIRVRGHGISKVDVDSMFSIAGIYLYAVCVLSTQYAFVPCHETTVQSRP